jgi:hypothetical protein
MIRTSECVAPVSRVTSLINQSDHWFIQCGVKWFASGCLCITLVKMRNAALQKKKKA